MIDEIDKEITKQLDLIKFFGNDLIFESVCQFQLNESLELIPWSRLNYSGIYLIEVKNNNTFFTFQEWLRDFKGRWEDPFYLRKFTPNFKKKRILSHFELNDWIPLYIGKSKSIKSRVHDHIYKELHKSTFAMKLLSRENMKNETFRISIITFNIKNYDTIMPKIESQLRNKINPLIGKQ